MTLPDDITPDVARTSAADERVCFAATDARCLYVTCYDQQQVSSGHAELLHALHRGQGTARAEEAEAGARRRADQPREARTSAAAAINALVLVKLVLNELLLPLKRNSSSSTRCHKLPLPCLSNHGNSQIGTKCLKNYC